MVHKNLRKVFDSMQDAFCSQCEGLSDCRRLHLEWSADRSYLVPSLTVIRQRLKKVLFRHCYNTI